MVSTRSGIFPDLANPRHVALAVLAASIATIGAALVFEHGFGFKPCKLCLEQRFPYYVAMPLAAGIVLVAHRWRGLAVAALAVLSLVFVVSAGLGAYHAGVEWGYFVGPNDCAGAPAAGPAGMGDFLNQLQSTRIVSCTDAAWRFLGLSLAGWNVLISLGLAGLAGLGAIFAFRAWPRGQRA